MIEKAFALASCVPELATNGKVAIYATTDRRVNLVLLIKDFDWQDRKKSECSRCPRCKHFILPADKSKVRAGLKYHDICSPLIKEAPNEVDTATRADGSVNID